MFRTFKTDIALAAMLVLGNIFFFSCLAGLGSSVPSAVWSRLPGEPAAIVLVTD